MGYYAPNPFSFTVNADGYALGAGSTSSRTFTLSGGNLVVTASASGHTHTFPSQSCVLVGRDTADVLTAKTLTSPILSAGTTASGGQPLTFTDGPLTGVTAAGALEFSGGTPYFTGVTGTGGRQQLMVCGAAFTTAIGTVTSLTQVTSALTATLPANQTWAFVAELCLSGTAAGVKFGFLVPSGATIEAQRSGVSAGASSYLSERANTTALGAVFGGNAGVDAPMRIGGTIKTSSAGSFAIQWAKVTSGTGTMYAGAHITTWRIG